MISVILPVHNGEKYLADAIKSVVDQTFADWELLVVDDGSTDSSASIADDFAHHDKRIKVFRVENGGVSYARNIGMDNASGDYISFLDADDLLHPSALSTLLSLIQSNGQADIASAAISHSRRFLARPIKDVHSRFYPGIEALEPLLYQTGVSNSACGKLYSRRVFTHERFKEGIRYEDLYFTFRAILSGRGVVASQAPVYFYRQHTDSFIHTWSASRLDVLSVTDTIQSELSPYPRRFQRAAIDRLLSANLNIFRLALHNGEDAIALRCWAAIKAHRSSALTTLRGRLKVKAASLLSYGGLRFFRFISLSLIGKDSTTKP